MDRAVLVLSAVLLNAALAGPRGWYAPLHLTRLTRYPATLVRDAERKLNRDNRSLAQRTQRGMALVAAVIVAGFIAGKICDWLFTSDLQFIDLLLLAALLPVRPTWDRVSQIRKALKTGAIARAKEALEGTPCKFHALLDDFGIARAGIEFLAVQFAEKILAPSLYYLLLGMPGLFIVRALVLLQETLTPPGAGQMFGDGFSKSTHIAHFALQYIPARIAAALWWLAVLFMPSGKPLDAAKQMRAGEWIEAAPETISLLSAAATLDVSLGGPASSYAGGQWIGAGTPKATHSHVRRALYLFALLHLLLFILLGFFI